MSLALRLFIFAGAVLLFVFMLRRIHKASVQMGDTIFWIIVSICLIILSVFSDIASFFAQLLRVESPANLVYLVIIAILIVKCFMLSMELSEQKNRINHLAQDIALREFQNGKEREERTQEDTACEARKD